MNRFIPDTFLDGLFRPLAMAAPNGWVYLEIIAPDLRFVFLILLAVLSVLLARRGERRPAVWASITFTAVAFAAWLMTSGNGRYFIPVLVLAGILCVALVHALPFSRGLRASLVLLMLALQGYAVQQNPPWNPWNPWGFYMWQQPAYYPLIVDREAREEPATYVTVSTISYSLIAPQFAAESRWMNLSWLLGSSEDSPSMRRAADLMREAKRLRVVLPGQSMPVGPEGHPSAGVVQRMARVLEVYRLRFARQEAGCRLLPLREPAVQASATVSGSAQKFATRQGFWVCEAEFHQPPPQEGPVPQPRELQVYEVLEHTCPRLFPPGLPKLQAIPGGWMRYYASADMTVYLLRDGSVHYKYHRALNPTAIGTLDQVLAPGFTMRCDEVPGRAGMPWDREI